MRKFQGPQAHEPFRVIKSIYYLYFEIIIQVLKYQLQQEPRLSHQCYKSPTIGWLIINILCKKNLVTSQLRKCLSIARTEGIRWEGVNSKMLLAKSEKKSPVPLFLYPQALIRLFHFLNPPVLNTEPKC